MEESARSDLEANGVAENIAGIAAAVNSMDLERYGRLVTDDFVNMNKDLKGEVTVTVGRQERLDVLAAFFADSPYLTKATMTPSEISVEGDRAFARIDGTLELTAKPGSTLPHLTIAVDLYLFYLKDEEHGWRSERSMGIERIDE